MAYQLQDTVDIDCSVSHVKTKNKKIKQERTHSGRQYIGWRLHLIQLGIILLIAKNYRLAGQ
jgi:long-subunit fatty acid transport protein